MSATASTSVAGSGLGNHKEFKIGGLSVLFPCKPYPSQFSMMDKIIRGIQRQQNCLLESPTGSGKSLALLSKQQDEIAKQASENEGGACCCSCHSKEVHPPPPQTSNADVGTKLSTSDADNINTAVGASSVTASTSVSAKEEKETSPVAASDDSDDEFKPLTKFRPAGKTSMVTRKKKRKPLSIEYEDSPSPASPFPASPAKDTEEENANACTSSSTHVAVTPCSQCSCGKDDKTPVRKVPKVYFGTRTHKQVAQIEVGCRFKDRVMKYQSQHAIKSMGLSSAWDLEDMVTLMRKKKTCPYFLTRGLKDQSDLIICPYNYLVDPLIRDSMEINLKDQIVLLDEAHNIEDAAREAASQSFTQEQIQRALQNMDELMEKNVNVADISKLRQMCHKLDSFIDEHSSSLTQVDFDQSYRLWSGFEIVAQLRRLDLGPEKCQQLASVLEKLKGAELEERMNNPGQDQTEALSAATGGLLESIFLVMKYIYKDDMKHAEDYRASIVKSIRYMPADHGFADFGLCRSVILTSGTLSPMDSFQSELGLPFPVVLEANHVIKDSQAVYRNMETFGFQDQLGQLILEVCKKVPKGVLCFLPSYKAVEKLSNRWKSTGLWRRLEAEKRVFSEPRGSDKVDFEQIMLSFSSVVRGQQGTDEDEGESSGDGALLFAVCRGKVSEGMDFADNFARAVITVGIPYPNFKDIQVELKRKYNDRYQASRHLLSGHLWYEIQAFRALNQALGRCIRHRRDWGALIIVDDRFVKNTNKYANGLSKWVRKKLHVHRKCSAMLESLSEFTSARIEEQQREESVDSSLMSTPLTPASQSGLYDSPRSALHDVSNLRSPSATSTPLTVGGLPVKVDSTPLEGGESLIERERKKSAIGSSPFLERKVPGGTQSRQQLTSPDAQNAGSAQVASIFARSSSSQVVSTTLAQAKLNAYVRETPTPKGQQKIIILPTALQSKVPITLFSPSLVAVPASPLTTTQSPLTPLAAVKAAHLPVTSTIHPAFLSAGTPAPPPKTVFVVPSPHGFNGQNGGVQLPPGCTSSQVLQALAQSAQTNANALMRTSSVQSSPSVGNTAHHKQFVVNSSSNVCQMPPVSSVKPTSLGVGPTTTASIRITWTSPSITANLNLSRTPGTTMATNKGNVTFSTASGAKSGVLPVLPTPAARPSVAATSPTVAAAPVTKLCVTALPTPASQTGLVTALPEAPSAKRGTLSAAQSLLPSTAAVPASKGGAGSSGLDPSLSMLFLPLKDPTLKPIMLVLPYASTTQQLISLPPQFQQAFGGQVLPVPPMIQRIVLAPTLEEAKNLFVSSLQGAGTSKMQAVPSSSGRQGSPGAVTSHPEAVTTCATTPKSTTHPVASQSTSAVSPALFDDTPPSQSPRGTMRSLLSGIILPNPASSGSESDVRPQTEQAVQASVPHIVKCSSQPPQCDDDIICVGVTSVGASGQQSTTSTQCTAPKVNKKQLFRKTPTKAISGNETQSSTDAVESVANTTTRDVLNSVEVASHIEDAGSGDSNPDNQGKVERRVRGSKRRSLSVGTREAKKGRTSDLMDEVSKEETKTMKCGSCGHVLLEDVKTSDYERRETMPSFLKGVTDKSSPEVLYFYGASITQKLKVADSTTDNTRCQQWPGGLEASVQLVCCPNCQASNTGKVLGARVTLSDPNASASTGQ
ncbi:hypothetical protein BaRGS_00027213, partial [Batillaria attramentaria]